MRAKEEEEEDDTRNKKKKRFGYFVNWHQFSIHPMCCWERNIFERFFFHCWFPQIVLEVDIECATHPFTLCFHICATSFFVQKVAINKPFFCFSSYSPFIYFVFFIISSACVRSNGNKCTNKNHNNIFIFFSFSISNEEREKKNETSL